MSTTINPVGTVSKPGSVMLRVDSIPWTPFPFEGVEFKLLRLDDNNSELTMIMRFAPGVKAPLHKHLGGAEVYTIAGHWSYQEGEVGPGDYAYEPGGVIHEPESENEEVVIFVNARGPVQNIEPDGSPGGMIDNDLLYELAAANGAVDHIKR